MESVAGVCVDGLLLLAVKSLYSCSEVCIGVGAVKSALLKGVGLRQMCVLSSLFFIIYMSGIDSHSRVDAGVTGWSCKVNSCFVRTI